LLENIFGLSIDELLAPPDKPAVVTATVRTGQTDDSLAVIFDWLYEHAGWRPSTSQQRIMSRLATLKAAEMINRHTRRVRVPHSRVTRALKVISEPRELGSQLVHLRRDVGHLRLDGCQAVVYLFRGTVRVRGGHVGLLAAAVGALLRAPRGVRAGQ
jgi:hypothetical protein